MKVVNSREYEEMKFEFIKKHDFDYTIETSQMDQYGRYYKQYTFADGAFWYETMMPVHETVTTVIHKCEISMNVEFLRTEFWTSDNSESNFLYEKY